MGLVFFLLSLSTAPPPSDCPVFELTVDSHDLYSLIGCAEILSRRSYATLVPFLPARYRRSVKDVLESGGGGEWRFAVRDTSSTAYYFRYGVSVDYSRGNPPSVYCKPLRLHLKPGNARGALKAGM